MEHSGSSDVSSPSMNEERSRLNSFATYPKPHDLNIKNLVKSGFFYINASTFVYCIGCGSEVKTWQDRDNASDPRFHQKNCDFVKANENQILLAKIEDNTVTAMESSAKATVHSNIDDTTKPLETGSTNAKEESTHEGNIQFATSNFLMNEPKKINNRYQQGYHRSMPPMQLGLPSTSAGNEPFYEHPLVTTEISQTVIHRQDSRNSSSTPSRSSFVSIAEVQAPSVSRQMHFSSRIENPDDYEEFMSKLNLRNAEHRLHTFNFYWDESIVFKNVRLLAKYGFYAQGQGDAVECFCCHVIVANWERNDDPKYRHFEMSPQCRFINGEECGDVPLPPERRSNTPSPIHNMRYYSPMPTPTHNVQPRSPMQSISRSSNSSHHSSPHQSLGYQSSPNTQATLTQLHQPVAQATPEDQGATGATGATGESYLPSSTLVELSNLHLAFPCANPLNPAMREDRARLQKLNDSRFRQNTRLRASNETVAQAGFYFYQTPDKVKCFYCGGGLMDFLEDDDPWEEHAKYYPECEYLLQQKGPAWINTISVQNPLVNRPQLPTTPSRVLPNVVSYSRSSSVSQIEDPHLENRDELLEEGMRTIQAQAVREMGFTEERIRQVMLEKIERNGCYYQSSESLINALVNGGDEDIPLDEQQGNVIDMSGQVIRIRGGDFVGPTIINGRLVGTRRGTHARGRSQISINGQPLDQYIASSFDHPFFNDPPAYRNRSTVRNREPAPTPPAFTPTPVSSIRETVGASGSSSTEQRLAEIERERRCKICLNNIADILFEPCGHICACSACSRLVQECPICRRRISRFVRTYHS